MNNSIGGEERPKIKDFKTWFWLMNHGGWILWFSFFFIPLILQMFYIPECIQMVVDSLTDNDYGTGLKILGSIFAVLAVLLPISGSSLIGYFIFYKFWKEWLNRK